MVKKNKLEQVVERMVAFKTLTSPTGSFSDKSKRRLENSGKEAYERLKEVENHCLPKDSNLVGRLRWSDEAVKGARAIRLGIDEFTQKHPRYGKILKESISKHRQIRRAYVEFGVREGDLPVEFYVDVIKECGITDERVALDLYKTIVEMSKQLGKKEEVYSFLVPE